MHVIIIAVVLIKQCLFSLEPTDATVTTQATEESDGFKTDILRQWLLNPQMMHE